MGNPNKPDRSSDAPRNLRTKPKANALALAALLSPALATSAQARAAFETSQPDTVNVQNTGGAGRTDITYNNGVNATIGETGFVASRVDAGHIALSQTAAHHDLAEQGFGLLRRQNGANVDTFVKDVPFPQPINNSLGSDLSKNGEDIWSSAIGCHGDGTGTIPVDSLFPAKNNSLGLNVVTNNNSSESLFLTSETIAANQNLCESADNGFFTSPTPYATMGHRFLGIRGTNYDRAFLWGNTMGIKEIKDDASNAPGVVPGPRLIDTSGVNPVQLELKPNGTFGPEPSNTSAGQPDSMLPGNRVLNQIYAANEIDLGNNDTVALVYAQVDNVDQFIAFQRNADGSFSEVQVDLVDQSGMSVYGNVDLNNNGVADAQEIVCDPNGQIQANGLIQCLNPNSWSRPEDGSRYTLGEGLTATLEGQGDNQQLVIGGVSEDPQTFRVIHATEGGKPVTNSADTFIPAPAAGFGIDATITVHSDVGPDGESHPVTLSGVEAVVNEDVIGVNDIIHGGPLPVGVPVQVRFAEATGAVTALSGTDVEQTVSVSPRGQVVEPDAAVPPPVDAAIPDAGAPDAAAPDAAAQIPDATNLDAFIVNPPAPDAAVPAEDAAQVPDAPVAPPTEPAQDAAVPAPDAPVAPDMPAPATEPPLPPDAAQLPPDAAAVAADAGAAQTPDMPAPATEPPPQPDAGVPPVDSGLPVVDMSPQTDVAPDCVPTDEICDGHDNNCNGLIDDGENGEPMTVKSFNPCANEMIDQICDHGTPIPLMETVCPQEPDAAVATPDGMIPVPTEKVDMAVAADARTQNNVLDDAGEKPEEKGGGAGGCTLAPGQKNKLPTGFEVFMSLLPAAVIRMRKRFNPKSLEPKITE